MKTRWDWWWRLLGPGLFVAVLWRVGPTECWTVVRGTNGAWFAGACVLVIPLVVAKGWRWQQIVRAQGVDLPLRQSTGQYAAGMLAGSVTPGKLGDLIKVPLLVSLGVPTGASVAVSLLDRVLDALALAVFGLVGILLMGWLPWSTIAWVLAGVSLCGAAAATIRRLPGRPAGVRNHSTRQTRSTAKMVDQWLSFRRAIGAVGRRWWPSLGVTTVAAWLPYYAAIYCCAKAIGLDIGVADLVGAVSVAAVLAMLPITIAGVGTRDAAFVVLLGRGGVAAREAVALSTLVLAWMAVNCGTFYILSVLGTRNPLRQGATRNGPAT